MNNVNWTALNAALCEALKVPPRITFEGGKMYADSERYERYPDLIADVSRLLKLLAARGQYDFHIWKAKNKPIPGVVIVVDDHEWWAGLGMAPARGYGAPEPGQALALAAAAALGLEVPRG